MNHYDTWKQETPDSPDYFCMICGVEISNGKCCKSENCIKEYEGYKYLKSKE